MDGHATVVVVVEYHNQLNPGASASRYWNSVESTIAEALDGSRP
jgi:hypothetical protein